MNEPAIESVLSTRGSMRLYGFTQTHERLIVECHQDGLRRFIHFVLVERISAPVSWSTKSPTVERHGDRLHYRDDGVEIVCAEMMANDRPN